MYGPRCYRDKSTQCFKISLYFLVEKKKKNQKAFSRVVCALCVSFLLTFTLFLPSANSQPLFLLRFHFCSIALQIFHLPRAHLFVWMTNLLFPVEI